MLASQDLEKTYISVYFKSKNFYVCRICLRNVDCIRTLLLNPNVRAFDE